MDLTAIKQKGISFLRKYRILLLFVLIGVVFMLLPAKRNNVENVSVVTQQEQRDITQELSEILSKIQGAGKVEVMLTVAKGEQIIYQTDVNSSGGETGGGKSDTVTVTDGNRVESGLIQQVISPVYQGAVVVCQGAEKAAVRLAIVEAVSNITGLGADKISVVKMK